MKKQKKKVLVAVSGGVDSSAALFLLQEAGFEVMGIYMKMGDEYQDSEAAARKVCQQLGVKFYPVNIDEKFKKKIIDYFVSAYQQGETPNPCVKCNKLIKFGELLRWRERLGADFLASGHYIQNKFSESTGEFELYKAVDQNKGQSYFLYNLKQEQLKYLLFPLGDKYKDDIKHLVMEKGIVIPKKESMDICFLHKNGKAIGQTEYLENIIKLKPGIIKVIKKETENNKRIEEIVGEHKGLPLYTIGQRKGVDIGGTGPYYVVSTDYSRNILYVVRDANDDLLFSANLYSKDNSFVSENKLKNKKLQAVIRYRHKAVDCSVEMMEGENNIYKTIFSENQRAVTVGQSVVWYSGERLIGGGVVIDKNMKNDIIDIT